MDVCDEIRYRDTILQKAYCGQKISPEERMWLITHSVYHSTLGSKYLLSDVIKIKANTVYNIKIKQEIVLCENMPVPVIGIPPYKKGYIRTAPFEKPIKMLGLTFNEISESAEVELKTPEGLLSIGYEYTYYDESQHINVCRSSISGFLGFAMKKEMLSDNKILYHCKLPNDKESDNFEKYVFSIELIEKENNQGTVL